MSGQLALGGSSARMRIDVSCDERKEGDVGRRTFRERPRDLLPKLCQFAVIVSWRSGEKVLVGERMGSGWGW